MPRTMLLNPKPTHIIFDMDGVLLDTEPLYSEAAQAVVGRYDKEYSWDLKRRTMGGDALVGARLVVETLDIPLSPEQYLAERGVVLRRLLAEAPELPGAEAFVAALKARGWPLAVATSSSSELCDIKLARHPWFDSFDVLVCGDDPEVPRRKPAPDIFLTAARRLGAEPGRCLVFEDSLNGLEAAVAAGMRVVAIVDENLELSAFEEATVSVRRYADLSLDALGL